MTPAPIDATVNANAEFGPLSAKLLEALDRIGQTPQQSPAVPAEVATTGPARNESTTKTAVSLGRSNPASDSIPVDIAAVFTETSQPLAAGIKWSDSRIAPIMNRKPIEAGSDTTEIRVADLNNSTLSNVPTSHMVPHSIDISTSDFQTSMPADTRPPLSAQVSRAVMEHLERHGIRQNDSVTVRLDPPELGEMTIRLSQTHEGLAVRVTAREAITMDMLFARGQEVESHLRDQQLNLKSLEFLKSDMSGNGYSQSQQQNDASRKSENLMNQVRRGSRGTSPAESRNGRAVIPESSYGLSFRA